MADVGLIPAAGLAERWGRYPKELLPVGGGTPAISETIRAMVVGGSVRRIVVVTAPSKIHAQQCLHSWTAHVAFVMQQGPQGNLWHAVRDALPWCAGRVLFAMPDTLWPKDAFKDDDPSEPFVLWTFRTHQPERFGIVDGQGITDKPAGLSGEHDAWGLIAWDERVTRHWLAHERTYAGFTAALNDAIATFGCARRSLEWYVDFATWEDYRQWISGSMRASIQTVSAE